MTTRSQQIEYIIENSKYIKNKTIQVQILDAAMRYVEDYCGDDASHHICESKGNPTGLNFFLDNYNDSTIQQIYNIIFNYIKKLNAPYSEIKPIPKMNFNFGE